MSDRLDVDKPAKNSCSKWCNNYCQSVLSGICRTKVLSSDMETLLRTNLKRCLTLVDLVAYGLASMLGGSVYVLTGSVMLKHTGPSVFVGYFVAGIVAALNALVYSELATRIPRAGSSYSYAYILLGELLGFLTGWSILLEYILGTCTVARGWSSMLDGLTGGKISSWIIENVGRMSNSGEVIAEYPDFIGAAFIIITASISCCGIRSGARVTGFFITINVLALSIISIYMFVFNSSTNLTIQSPTTVNSFPSYSGFLPFGIGGLVGGIAICFNAYIGFDAISACAEETKVPSRDLPRANMLAVATVTAVTTLATLALVMYYPWYLVSADIPFLSVLKDNFNGGSLSARTGMFYFIGCGCLIGLTSSELSNMVAGPRISYAIAEDGLLPRCCANVCHPFKTPVVATAFFAAVTIVLEMIFSILSLADFLSLGTLMAYSMGSIGLLMLRYGTPPEENMSGSVNTVNPNAEKLPVTDLDIVLRTGKPGYLKNGCQKWLSVKCIRWLNSGPPGSAIVILISVYVTLNAILIILLKTGESEGLWPIWRLVIVPVFLLMMLLCILVMCAFMQYKPPRLDLFRLPLVPLFPCATMSINMFLISELSWVTWIRFLVWLAFGLLLYFFYGVCHSSATAQKKDLWNFEEPVGYKTLKESPNLNGDRRG